jgi:hypothetical protein
MPQAASINSLSVAFEVMKAVRADGLERDQEYRPFVQATSGSSSRRWPGRLGRDLNALDCRGRAQSAQWPIFGQHRSQRAAHSRLHAERAANYGLSMFSNNSSGLKMAGNVSSSRTR